MMDFIQEHITWVFSGIGVFILSVFWGIKRLKKNNNKIKNGDNNIQSGRDTIIKK